MTDQKERWKGIDLDWSSSRSYVLNGKDREFCVTGEKQGSITKSKLKSRIRDNRVRALPLRFQDLFDDIALIESSDIEFLNADQKVRIWREILSVETRHNIIVDHHFLQAPTEHSVQTQFGAGFGAIFRNLAPPYEEEIIYEDDIVKETVKKLDDINSDIVWGFILGLFSYPNDQYKKEADHIQKIISDLDTKAESRLDFIERDKKQEKARDEIGKEVEEGIIEILQDQGISIKQPPVSEYDLLSVSEFSRYPFPVEEMYVFSPRATSVISHRISTTVQ